MTGTDELYHLLPAVYRSRDAAVGYPLRTLLRVMDGQRQQLTGQTAQMYDDWFIETCRDWAVPHLAALVDAPITALGGSAVDRAGGPLTARSRRRQVANAIRDRAAVGTLAGLERMATEITGWPCRAVETALTVATTQSVRFPGITGGPLADTRDGDTLERLDSPFDTTTHLPDVRRLSSARRPGRRNLPTVALAVWRLTPDGPDRAPAAPVDDAGRYTFDVLGRDTALCVRPRPRPAGTAPPTPLDVPTGITRTALQRSPELLYGPDRSLCIYLGSEPVPRQRIIAADLSQWRHRPRPRQVLVDPVHGRIAFPDGAPPDAGVWVRYSRLIVGPIGGGFYPRPTPDTDQRVYPVSAAQGTDLTSIGAAVQAWRADRDTGAAGPHAVIEITDNEVYPEPLHLRLRPGETLHIRSGQGYRPVLHPTPAEPGQPPALRVSAADPTPQPPPRRGHRPRQTPTAATPAPPQPPAATDATTPTADPAAAAAPEVAFTGVWITGGPLELTGRLGHVTLTHCTLTADPRQTDEQADERGGDSLLLRSATCPVTVRSCVIAGIRADTADPQGDPVPVDIRDSVLHSPRAAGDAVAGGDRRGAYLELSLRRVTVLGGVRVHQVGVVRDSILTGTLRCTRVQVGAVSFCYLPPASVTPRRIRCQPDLAITATQDGDRADAAARVTPRFDSVHPGSCGYAKLTDDAAPELLRGAHDEGEMGAHHDVWFTLRATEFRARLPDVTPVGTDVDLLYAT